MIPSLSEPESPLQPRHSPTQDMLPAVLPNFRISYLLSSNGGWVASREAYPSRWLRPSSPILTGRRGPSQAIAQPRNASPFPTSRLRSRMYLIVFAVQKTSPLLFRHLRRAKASHMHSRRAKAKAFYEQPAVGREEHYRLEATSRVEDSKRLQERGYGTAVLHASASFIYLRTRSPHGHLTFAAEDRGQRATSPRSKWKRGRSDAQ